jgi:hypothetical protein
MCSLVSGENLIVEHICQDMMPGTFVMSMRRVNTVRPSSSYVSIAPDTML